MSTTMANESMMIQLKGDSPWLARLADVGPAFLRDLRRRARESFTGPAGAIGSKDERFQYTNFEALRNLQFQAAEATAPDGVDIDSLFIPGLDAITIVFVNGRFDAERSTLDRLPDEVTIKRISDALAESPQLIEPYLGKALAPDFDPFTALNTASFEDGLFVHVPRGVRLERPIYIASVTAAPAVVCGDGGDGGGGEALITNPRNLIVAEAGAGAIIVEDYIGAGDGDPVYLTNAATEVIVEEEAEVEHYYLERESERAYNVGTLRVLQARNSRFTSHSVLFGGSVVRNNVLPSLNGENCFSVLNGLYVGHQDQHLDNFMRVEHNHPGGDSRQYYKGVLDDRARGVFSGRIIVARGAQKTDAKQSNQNLLLSDDARANTRPQLEIYADDVKCTHGATIGELDEEAIFYLRARGLSDLEARSLLIHAFAAECLERMTLEPVRDELERLLEQRLPLARG